MRVCVHVIGVCSSHADYQHTETTVHAIDHPPTYPHTCRQAWHSPPASGGPPPLSACELPPVPSIKRAASALRHVCACLCVHVCVHVFLWVLAYVCACVCLREKQRERVCVCACLRVRVCVHVMGVGTSHADMLTVSALQGHAHSRSVAVYV